MGALREFAGRRLAALRELGFWALELAAPVLRAADDFARAPDDFARVPDDFVLRVPVLRLPVLRLPLLDPLALWLRVLPRLAA